MEWCRCGVEGLLIVGLFITGEIGSERIKRHSLGSHPGVQLTAHGQIHNEVRCSLHLELA